MPYFIWSKMQMESGLSLSQILVLKEAERLAGDGVFWWGIGSALDRDAICRAAMNAGGTLPVLFSLMLSRPQRIDTHPDHVNLWTKWEADGKAQELPIHVLEFSRGHARRFHYALICRSPIPLTLVSYPFDPSCCRNPSGKPVGSNQVTALLQGDIEDRNHSSGTYHFGFRATLVDPWFVKLIQPQRAASTDVQLSDAWKSQWRNFATRLKSGGDPAC
ncbi:MAG: hypothetical protein WB678_19605 [Stellaceae bacterium]